MELDSKQVSHFLKSLSNDFRLKLITVTDPARVVSLINFDQFLKNNSLEVERIAIVSGSMNEPELLFCPVNAQVNLLSFEDDPVLFDLNKDWSRSAWKQHHEVYDLVLCEQVLEHCLNPARAFHNLATLLKPGGVLHVSVPAINNTHGEPHYFYAGFPTSTLEAFAKKADLTVMACNSWRSDKAARMYATCDWAPLAESGPLIFFLQGLWLSRTKPRAALRIFLGRLKNLLTFPFQGLFSPSKNRNAVVTWLFATKPL